jgi:hypothetical protein
MTTEDTTNERADGWLSEDMEAAADAANAAEPAVDWEALGAIEREAQELQAQGKLTGDEVDRLVEAARAKVPPKREDVIEDLRRDLRALL